MRKTIKNLLTVITSAFLLISMSEITITKADGGPVLTIDTVQIDVGDIPEDRHIKVPVILENNPGINGYIFTVQADSRLGADQFSLTQNESDDIASISNGIYDYDLNIININLTIQTDDWYYENGSFFSFNFELPENCHTGDFFPIDFIETSQYKPVRYSMPDGIIRYNEISGSIVSGGIRITGQDPGEANESVPDQTSDPEPSAVPDPEPQTAAPAETEPDQTMTSEGTTSEVSASSAVSVSSVSSAVTLVTNSAHTSYISSDTSAEITAASQITSDMLPSDTALSESSSEKNRPDTSVSPVIPAVIITAAAISAILLVMTKRRKSDRNDK